MFKTIERKILIDEEELDMQINVSEWVCVIRCATGVEIYDTEAK